MERECFEELLSEDGAVSERGRDWRKPHSTTGRPEKPHLPNAVPNAPAHRRSGLLPANHAIQLSIGCLLTTLKDMLPTFQLVK